MAYDSPNQTVRREHCATTVAGATTAGARFRHFQAIKLKKVHAGVITAGTATTHGYGIYRGTTSVGAIALSTSTAGAFASSAALNLELASMEALEVRSLADATGVSNIVYEFEVLPGATQS